MKKRLFVYEDETLKWISVREWIDAWTWDTCWRGLWDLNRARGGRLFRILRSAVRNKGWYLFRFSDKEVVENVCRTVDDWNFRFDHRDGDDEEGSESSVL